VIGYVGVDVPVELVPGGVRLAPVEGVDPSFADRVLGRGVDEPTRLILAGLLEDAYDVETVVLCHDTEHTVRLYAALRALGREVLFVDVLHQPRESTLAYNRRRLEQLAAQLGSSPEIAAANRVRDRIAELGRLRREGRVSSVEALACLRDPLREPQLQEPAGKRVFMLGSGHDRPDVYAEIDARGWVVVGEDHAWGESVYAGRVDEDGDPFDALTRYYTPRRTSNPEGAEVALVWIREGDEALAWSIPKWRRALDIPLEVLQ
jgi:2-hydroxyglutaryl-CoA dehydratase, D-component